MGPLAGPLRNLVGRRFVPAEIREYFRDVEDHLTRVREQTLARRLKYVAPAEALVEQEVRHFLADWDRRRSGPVIGQLTAEADKLRAEIVGPLLSKLNGRLTDDDKKYIAGAFRLFQNKLLHNPKAALQEASREGEARTMLEAVRKLFGLGE